MFMPVYTAPTTPASLPLVEADKRIPADRPMGVPFSEIKHAFLRDKNSRRNPGGFVEQPGISIASATRESTEEGSWRSMTSNQVSCYDYDYTRQLERERHEEWLESFPEPKPRNIPAHRFRTEFESIEHTRGLGTKRKHSCESRSMDRSKQHRRALRNTFVPASHPAMTKAMRLDRDIANEAYVLSEREREERQYEARRFHQGLLGLEELQEYEVRVRAANEEIDYFWAEGCFWPEGDKSWFRSEWEEEYTEWVVKTNRALASKG